MASKPKVRLPFIAVFVLVVLPAGLATLFTINTGVEPLGLFLFLVLLEAIGLIFLAIVLGLTALYDKFVAERVWKLRERRRISRLPQVVRCQNNGVYVVARKRDYEAARKRHPYQYPFILPLLIFMEPKTTWGEVLTRENPRYYLPASTTGNLEEMRKLLEGCNVEWTEMFVPFSSRVVGENWEKQAEIFPRIPLDEAYRLIHGKRRRSPIPAPAVATA